MQIDKKIIYRTKQRWLYNYTIKTITRKNRPKTLNPRDKKIIKYIIYKKPKLTYKEIEKSLS